MQVGLSCPLRSIPEGIFLHCIEYKPGNMSKIARAAGTFVFIINKFFT